MGYVVYETLFGLFFGRDVNLENRPASSPFSFVLMVAKVFTKGEPSTIFTHAFHLFCLLFLLSLHF